MKRIVVISLLAALTTLTACNTIQGMGKDISAVGHSVSKAAQ